MNARKRLGRNKEQKPMSERRNILSILAKRACTGGLFTLVNKFVNLSKQQRLCASRERGLHTVENQAESYGLLISHKHLCG